MVCVERNVPVSSFTFLDEPSVTLPGCRATNADIQSRRNVIYNKCHYPSCFQTKISIPNRRVSQDIPIHNMCFSENPLAVQPEICTFADAIVDSVW